MRLEFLYNSSQVAGCSESSRLSSALRDLVTREASLHILLKPLATQFKGLGRAATMKVLYRSLQIPGISVALDNGRCSISEDGYMPCDAQCQREVFAPNLQCEDA